MPNPCWLLYIIVIGLVAGALASVIIPTPLGFLGAIIVGVIGAIIGSYLFPTLGFYVTGDPTIASIITATVGANVLLLFVMRLARR